MINLIVGEYLRNLKEKNELDTIFLSLLEQMKFKIIKSTRSSTGQPEYGNDITAIKIDNDGIKKIFIFQLKGGNDRNLTERIFDKKDGVRDSILQALDVDYIDKSKPELNGLKKKIVLVHNGEINSNFSLQFSSFIDKYIFKNSDVEFERWDIFKLTELFSKYLFNEYLLVKKNYLNLFKKTLAFIDIPEGSFIYFKQLIDSLLKEISFYKKNNFKKMLSLFCMMGTMIFHYAKESDNLESAKQCLSYMLLQAWGWVLENKVENKKYVIEEVLKLNYIHHLMLEDYFKKTIGIATNRDGLFFEKGFEYEIIGYPLRCFEYIGYLVYHLYFYPFFLNKKNNELKKVIIGVLDTLFKILENNNGCSRPLLDNHSISILLVIKLFLSNGQIDRVKFYLNEIFTSLAKIKTIRNRMPELRNNIDSLIEYCVTNIKPYNYTDSSSYLMTLLLDICVLIGCKELYNEFIDFLTKDLDLLLFYPIKNIVENEHLLFQKEILEEGYTEIIQIRKIEIANHPLLTFEEYSEKLNKIDGKKIEYRTDKSGLYHLRLLAHLFYKTPFFPDEWRIMKINED